MTTPAYPYPQYPLDSAETFQALVPFLQHGTRNSHREVPFAPDLDPTLTAELTLMPNPLALLGDNPRATDPAISRGLPNLSIYAVVIRRTGTHITTLTSKTAPSGL